jgi:hypothetical protein
MKSRRTKSSLSQRRTVPKTPFTILPIEAPSNFSIFENRSGTLAFFDKIINILEKPTKENRNLNLYIDTKNVNTVTIDALMYLIAMMKNISLVYHRNSQYNLIFAGDLPVEPSARFLFEECGFMDFVESINKPIKKGYVTPAPNVDYFKIATGTAAEGSDASPVCDYVGSKANTNRIGTKFLQTILIELMGNTKEHAYLGKNNPFIIDNWYIFAENTAECIKFIFLDTGDGIPATVKKNFRERVSAARRVKHGELISSAVDGDFRSKTGLDNRGLGLPGVYRFYNEGYIENLKIFSGNGCFEESRNNPRQAYDEKEALRGTLFYWEIDKNLFRKEEHYGQNNY